MSDIELLTQVLKTNPGSIYITASGMTIYFLVGPEEKLMYLASMGKNFNDMTEEEINSLIQKAVSP